MAMIANRNDNYFKGGHQQGFSPQFIKNSLQFHQGVGPYGPTYFSEVGRLTGLQEIYLTTGFRRNVTEHNFQENSNRNQVFLVGN